MDPGRAPGEDLARWAARRAPELLARAEAEAIAVLRDALINAAAGAREHRDAVSPAASSARTHAEDERGELLWVYGVLRAEDPCPQELPGVHGDSVVRAEPGSGLVALVSPVPRAEFAAEPLRENLNDLVWLERVARGHEAVLDAALQMSTIVPLRMCTLYESGDSVRRMLEREHDAFADALDALDGRWEWAVKVLVDRDRLIDAAGARRGRSADVDQELADHGEGGAYMLRRRLERQLREEADALGFEVAEQVHARLADWAVDAARRPPQNRDLSGHEGAMVLNAAYLVARDRVDELRMLVAELEEHHRDVGVRIELTGPWPPFNFVAPRDGTVTA